MASIIGDTTVGDRDSPVVLKGSFLSKIYGGGPDFIIEVIKKRKKIEIAYAIPLFI